MTTPAQLRRAALSQPEAAEGAGTGGAAFTVHGRTFAAADGGGAALLHLPAAEADEVLAAYRTARRLTRDGARVVRLPLGDVDGQALNHWVRRAWLSRAPRTLAERASAADSAVPGTVGDLPRAIGGPATRALAGAGLTTLAAVADLSRAEVQDLHGVGPKAVRLLDEALAASGRRFRD